LIPLFMVLIGKLSENHTKRQWVALSRLGAYFLDTLQGLFTLMTLGRSKERAVEIREVSDRYRIVTMNVLRITFLSAFVLEMIATISTALVAVEIGLRLLYSRLEFQHAFFILLIAPEFYLPLRNLSLRYHAGMSGLTAATRIFELLDTPEKEIAHAVEKKHADPFSEPFKLTFKDVSYKYPGNADHALERINLEIESGKHYALVGESGAGKSTLAYLFLRFINPDEGQIMLNGEDIQSWDAEVWRRKIGWVPQTPRLFNTCLLENVRLNDPNHSLSEVESVIRSVSLDSLVASLPQGLETPLLEGGVRLSGGEARRVVLARCLLKQAPMLIMDEPNGWRNEQHSPSRTDFRRCFRQTESLYYDMDGWLKRELIWNCRKCVGNTLN
jgi:ATP-binding cassette subfamily C protein CydD